MVFTLARYPPTSSDGHRHARRSHRCAASSKYDRGLGTNLSGPPRSRRASPLRFMMAPKDRRQVKTLDTSLLNSKLHSVKQQISASASASLAAAVPGSSSGRVQRSLSRSSKTFRRPRGPPHGRGRSSRSPFGGRSARGRRTPDRSLQPRRRQRASASPRPLGISPRRRSPPRHRGYSSPRRCSGDRSPPPRAAPRPCLQGQILKGDTSETA